MPYLMDLCPEILEEVTLKLESVEEVIALGSSSCRLARIVGQERLWRVVLARTELVEEDGRMMEDRVRAITTFLSSLQDSKAIFSLLHQTIYDRYPAELEGWNKENITVSCPSSTQLHYVSGLGVELLDLTEREEARHRVHKIKKWMISSSLLLSLASHQRDQITELVTGIINCTTEEEGSALVSLLERCTTWRVRWLDLLGKVGGLTWEGLGREVARGKLGNVRATREVVRRGRKEDLRAVWQNTERWWGVDGERIWKEDGEEEGWGKIEEIIQ